MKARDEPHRLSPETFLQRLADENPERKKGRLKVFLGFSAGVGKTYAMLQEASKARAAGTDVVVGIVESHGRADTARLIDQLEIEILPPRYMTGEDKHGGAEFDIDMALARHPQKILVDELAHNNVRGSRNQKRWQDVRELLEAGIDVDTCLNVQHVESLHDIVAQITGVKVQERVPDSFIDEALEIELIDLPPELLLERLRNGLVYGADRAERAMQNFFRKGNLIALRELSLRYTANHVEKQMLRYKESEGIERIWPATDCILVCVSASPQSMRLVRAGKRMADALKSRWICVFVARPGHHEHVARRDRARLYRTLTQAELLGAEVVELLDDDVAGCLADFAVRKNASRIVIGKTAGSRLREILSGGSLVDKLVRLSGEIDVVVIGGSQDQQNDEPAQLPTQIKRKKQRARAYVLSVAYIFAASCVCALVRDRLESANLIMLYMLAVTITALYCGRGPAVLASFLSVAVFDFCFVPPFYTFAVSDTQYLVTFIIMLAIALTITTLASRMREQAQAVAERERKTSSLYAFSRQLASASSRAQVIELGKLHIAEIFDCQCEIALTIDDCVDFKADPAIVDWVLKNNVAAGLSTSTLPAAPYLYLPMRIMLKDMATIGVVAVKPAQSDYDLDKQKLLETFVSILAQAVQSQNQ